MQQQEHSLQIKTRASERMCAHCPPERVCAWSCVQGMNSADIITGAVLEQRSNWALDPGNDPGTEATQQALWELYNG